MGVVANPAVTMSEAMLPPTYVVAAEGSELTIGIRLRNMPMATEWSRPQAYGALLAADGIPEGEVT